MISQSLTNTFLTIFLLVGAALSVLFSLPAFSSMESLRILRVDDNSTAAAPDGSSWSKAYPTLQAALAAAGSPSAANPVEIWVAAGRYYPDEGGGQTNNNPAAAFALKNFTALYGGFAGTETARSQRNPAVNLSVLSGDIDKNDPANAAGIVTTTANIIGSNADHVVLAIGVNATAVLDGFTITAGQADGATTTPCGPACGGGLAVLGGNPTLTNLVFTGNAATLWGGALYAVDTTKSTWTKLAFTNNSAGEKGGGLFNETSTGLVFSDGTFTGNSAGIDGGGIFNNYSISHFDRLIMTGNSAGKSGGGIFSFDSLITVTLSTLISNTAVTNGGGIFNDYNKGTFNSVSLQQNNATSGGGIFNNFSTVRLRDLTASGNLASVSGGGMFNFTSDVHLVNGTFTGNFADAGGGLFNYTSSPTLTNGIFSGNSAIMDGGAIYNFSGSAPLLNNLSVVANQAGGSGGGLVQNEGGATLRNSIVWLNGDGSGGSQAAQISLGVSSTVTVSYSLISGTAPFTGTGNIIGDPLFARNPDAGDGSWTTLADNDYGDLRLSDGSPAVNAGSSALLPADTLDMDQDGNVLEPLSVDRSGNQRVVQGQVDLGAYERLASLARLYVRQGVSAAGNGASWATPLKFLQDALFIAGPGTEIWVARGVYYPGIYRTDSFALEPGVAIYGGFAGTESALSQRSWQANPTVLSGDIDRNDAADPTGVVNSPTAITGANAYHVVTGSNLTPTARLDGFTITAGQANGSAANSEGGGLWNTNGNPTLANLQFVGNYGAAGGGMAHQNGSPSLTAVTFLNNGAGSTGGGLYLSDGSPVVENATFSGNSAGTAGGGLAVYSGSPTLTNAIFAGNIAATGGAIYHNAANSLLTNITLARNVGQGLGGGIYNDAGSGPTIRNTIISHNSDSTGGTQAAQIYLQGASQVTVTYSLISGTSPYTGSQNIVGNPQFVQLPTPGDGSWLSRGDNSYGDLRLLTGSPAIDRGLNAICPAKDIRGFNRPLDGDGNGSAICDLGAYEHAVVTADFSAAPVEGKPPLAVTFTNLSTGPFTTCTWNYGDGQNSSRCSSHVYTFTRTGSFTVTLTVSSGESTASKTRTGLIGVSNYELFIPYIQR